MFGFEAPAGWRELADDLASVGMAAGDNLIMHSSFKSVGRTEHGPATLVEAVMSVIGDAGTLMVPTYTYSLPIWNTEPFDLNQSKSRVGAVTEHIRKLPTSVRSFHPTHSVAVLGRDAASIAANHLHATPIGRGSPYERMLEKKAKVLMLGTTQDTNSSLHLCEILAELPYVHVCFTPDADFELSWFRNEMDQIEYSQIFEMPGCSRGFRNIEAGLINRGVLKEVVVGKAICQLLDMREMAEATVKMLSADPILLLCNLPGCAICPKRRELMRKAS